MELDEFQNLLTDVFDYLSDQDSFRDELENNRIRTFDEAGLLTNDKGILLKLHNGQEFLIRIQHYN
jgi:hypothetical protein